MNRDAKLIARLAKMHARRDAMATDLVKLDERIKAVTRELAAERGVIFLRGDSIKREIAERPIEQRSAP